MVFISAQQLSGGPFVFAVKGGRGSTHSAYFEREDCIPHRSVWLRQAVMALNPESLRRLLTVHRPLPHPAGTSSADRLD